MEAGDNRVDNWIGCAVVLFILAVVTLAVAMISLRGG